jgi:hypothetical protein
MLQAEQILNERYQLKRKLGQMQGVKLGWRKILESHPLNR